MTPASVTDAAARARALLAAIADRPRPAGSAAEAAARAHVAAELHAAGFGVREEPFAYSAAVGRLATPLGGVLSIAVLAAAAVRGRAGAPGAALALLVGALVVGGGAGAWAARHGVLALPAMRRTSVNLVATRGEGMPTVWLVAHLDSKAQPVPIGLRALGVMGTIVAWVGALALAVGAWRGWLAPAPAAWIAVAALGVVAGLPVAASVVTDRSPGALDNASGVATVLLAAAQARAPSLGVLVPSAEELGLAGARAWAEAWRRSGRSPGVALNVDGVDDAGGLTAMLGAGPTTGALAALRAGAAQAGVALGTRRLVPGILTDAVALAATGWSTLTLSRGTWRTLARIHTPADRRERLDGRGIAEAARVLAAAADAAADAATRASSAPAVERAGAPGRLPTTGPAA